MASTSQPKPLFWMSSTQDDLRAFPQAVRQVMGYALYLAQVGDKHLDAKPLKASPVQRCWRSSRIMMVTRSVWSIPCGLLTPSMPYTPFKRNRSEVSPPRNGKSNGFGNGSDKPRRIMKDGTASQEVNNRE
jgi:hypothetical protein